jgi:hypothetical protein
MGLTLRPNNVANDQPMSIWNFRLDETRVTLSTRQNEGKQTRVTLSTRQNEDKQTRVTLSTRQNEDKQTITVCY